MFVDSDDGGHPAGAGRVDEYCDYDDGFEFEPYVRFGPVVDPRGRPGAVLAEQCQSAAVVPSLLDDGEVLDVVEGIDRVSRWAAAVRIRMLAEFADRHPAGSSAVRPGGDVAVPVDRWVPDEVGMTLRIARLEALAEIARARRLVHVLPDTLELLEAGRIDERRADAIASATALLPDEMAREVEARVLAKAPDATLKQLRERVRRAVARVDPDGAYRRHKEAVKERRVSIRSLEDGMASLWFYGPAEQIEAAWTMADRLARAPRDASDERSLDERRFDLAVQVLQGRVTVTDMGDVERAVDAALDALDTDADADSGEAVTPSSADSGSADSGSADSGSADSGSADSGSADSGSGTTGSGSVASPADTADPADGPDPTGARVDRASLVAIVTQVLAGRPPMHATVHRPQIQVVIALDTLLGGDRPAELVGHGPIDAVTARALAAGGVWARLVTDPLSGRLLDYGRTVYAPPADLADFVRARDQICRGPGCTRRIGELDHHVQFGGGHGGTTSEANLDGYCIHCHMLKDAPGWNVVAGADRTLTWISPNGRRTVTEPYDYRPFTDALPTADGGVSADGSADPVASGLAAARVPEDDDGDPPPF